MCVSSNPGEEIDDGGMDQEHFRSRHGLHALVRPEAGRQRKSEELGRAGKAYDAYKEQSWFC